MSTPDVPLALAYTADTLIAQLRRGQTPVDLRIEITFTPDALATVTNRRPDVLSIERLCGVPVTFPEKPLPHRHAFQSGVDWCMTLTAEHGAVDIELNRYGTLAALLNT